MTDKPNADTVMDTIMGHEQRGHDYDPENPPEQTQRLIDDLEAAGAPKSMVEDAQEGWYHDYVSEHPLPKALLVSECYNYGLEEIARRVKEGHYDP